MIQEPKVRIRPATVVDVGAIANLAAQFDEYLRDLGDTADFHLTAEAILRDGFGKNPAFAGLVAEQDGTVVGYLLYHFGYLAEKASRILHVVDLYVAETARRQGVGRALMAAVAKICRDAGGTELFWSIYIPNKLAASFYEGIGARYTKDLRFMRMNADLL